MKEIEDQIVSSRINEAKYNKRYKEILAEGTPKYLKKGNRHFC